MLHKLRRHMKHINKTMRLKRGSKKLIKRHMKHTHTITAKNRK